MYVYHDREIAPAGDLDFIAAAREYMPRLVAGRFPTMQARICSGRRFQTPSNHRAALTPLGRGGGAADRRPSPF
jgi:hypothetical protein